MAAGCTIRKPRGINALVSSDRYRAQLGGAFECDRVLPALALPECDRGGGVTGALGG